jgi:formate hydrogenlyase subunit 7
MTDLLDETTRDATDRLKARVQRLFGRSLHIRHVDAGSCNACESEIKLLTNPYYDIQRLGIFFTTSPRHADLLLVTGPVTRTMEDPLRQTYEAMPDPRLVVAVGACACSGGIFGPSAFSLGGVGEVLPVDVFIPGCPPSPLTLTHGLLLALGRAEQRMHGSTQSVRSSRPLQLLSPRSGEKELL